MEKLWRKIKIRKTCLEISSFVFLIVSILIMNSCQIFTNPVTPAGYEGYLIKSPLIFGEKKFYGKQVGQMSPGLSWRLFVVNIDMRPTTKDEEFAVPAKDQLNLKFIAHAIISLKPNSVKEIVEKYSADQWYIRNVQQLFRSIVYDEVSKYNAIETIEKRKEMGEDIKVKLRATFSNTPFIVQDIVIGNISLPKTVSDAVEQKIKTDQELEQKLKQIEVTKREAQIRIEEARGIAKSQEIIQGTLTPQYLQHEAIITMKALAGSPNTTFIYVPTDSHGGIPLVNPVASPKNK